ncbi:MAG: ATP-binding cassette domain-containing protein [SAR324 cluster bacterium]|nr:ATP-binding cassette domain-containing protein [SAR324 cluster bacterium]
MPDSAPTAQTGTALLALDKVSTRLGFNEVLSDLNWTFRSGESWAVVGPNGAGKTTLVQVLLQRRPYFQGTIERHPELLKPERIGYVALHQQKQLIAREERRDRWEDYSGKEEKGLTCRNWVTEEVHPDPDELERLAARFQMTDLLDRPLRQYSNGELRKTLLLRALLTHPALLLLDEPYDGLDANSTAWLKRTLGDLINDGFPVLLVTHRADEVVPEITHVLALKAGRIFQQGPRQEVLCDEVLHDLYDPAFGQDSATLRKERPLPVPEATAPNTTPPVVMRNVTVRYGEKVVLNGLDWTVQPGENWMVVGPNGAGKSTLLNLISGDHLQGYSNDIRIFGQKRGSGESIWDLKQRIGLVSSEFQVKYRNDLLGRHVILSGFFDSIGLYRQASPAQRAQADTWIAALGLEELSAGKYQLLSYGQQRLILLARALVKHPDLLILDEPCQGLDPQNRERILRLVDRIGSETATQVLYITHATEDTLRCVHHVLCFVPQPEGGFRPQFETAENFP